MSKFVENLLVALFIVTIILSIFWVVIQPILDVISKLYPQATNYISIFMYVAIGIVGGFALLFYIASRSNPESTNATSIQKVPEANSNVNIEQILGEVDSGSFSDERKIAIRAILEMLNDKLWSEPLPEIIGDLRKQYKDNLRLSSPYVQQFVALYI